MSYLVGALPGHTMRNSDDQENLLFNYKDLGRVSRSEHYGCQTLNI